MDKSDIKYSVLMSVYCKEKSEYLEYSIKSMLNQTIMPNEFVIVKDGKLTKELEEILDKYKTLYPEIFKLISLEKNLGLGLALKVGVENCSNELIARMDSDDYSFPTRIQKQLEKFNSDKELDIIGTNVKEFQDDINNVISLVKLPELNDEIYKFSKKRCPFRHPSIMLKKSFIMKIGNYREFYLCEDYDLYVRLIRKNAKCYNIQEELVCMRINKDFYKRRGGIKYLSSIMKFKNEQLNLKYFTVGEYIKTVVPHIIVCLMPNTFRDFVYRNLLRKNYKGEKV